jgi:hypothetical protein
MGQTSPKAGVVGPSIRVRVRVRVGVRVRVRDRVRVMVRVRDRVRVRVMVRDRVRPRVRVRVWTFDARPVQPTRNSHILPLVGWGDVP